MLIYSLVEAHSRFTEIFTGANVTIGMKVGDFSEQRAKYKRIANGRIHRRELIVLNFQRRDERDGVKFTGHDTSQLIVGQVKQFDATIAHVRVVGGDLSTQLVMVDHHQFDAIHPRGGIGPISR